MVSFHLHCCWTWQQASCTPPMPVTRCPGVMQITSEGLASQHNRFGKSAQAWHAALCKAQRKACQQRGQGAVGAWVSTQLLRMHLASAVVGCIFQGCCFEQKASCSQHTSVEVTGPPEQQEGTLAWQALCPPKSLPKLRPITTPSPAGHAEDGALDCGAPAGLAPEPPAAHGPKRGVLLHAPAPGGGLP